MSKSKKILIIIMLLIIIPIAIFVFSLYRKHLIIQDILEKQNSYIGSNNYYVEELNYDANNILVKYYFLDGKISEKHETDDESYYRYYEDGKENSYVDYKGEKLAYLDLNTTQLIYKEYEFFEKSFQFTGRKSDYFWFLLYTKISSEKYDGKDCYVIDVNDSLMRYMNVSCTAGLPGKDSGRVECKICFEKDTGLVRENTYSRKRYNYKFGQVTEADFIEPDVSQYRVVDDYNMVGIRMNQQLNFKFSSLMLYTAEFNLKFANLSGLQNGLTVKEVLNIILENIIENKKLDDYLPDIIYLENTSDNNLKKNMSNIEELDDKDIENLTDEECNSIALNNPFEFTYDKESSFKIISGLYDTNVDAIFNLRSMIDDDQEYQIVFMKDSRITSR